MGASADECNAKINWRNCQSRLCHTSLRARSPVAKQSFQYNGSVLTNVSALYSSLRACPDSEHALLADRHVAGRQVPGRLGGTIWADTRSIETALARRAFDLDPCRFGWRSARDRQRDRRIEGPVR